MIDGKQLVEVSCKYLGVPYTTMDCQRFVEKSLEDCGWKIDLSGSNAWYRKVRSEGWIGTPEECKKEFGGIPKGAFLFVHVFDGGEEARGYHDGLGNAKHIGLYTGLSGQEMVQLAIDAGVNASKAKAANFGNGAINSSSTRKQVATSKFEGKSISGGWNTIGLLPDRIVYEGVPSKPEPTPDPDQTVVWSENGKPVKMRKGPSAKNSIVAYVPCGQPVEVLENRDGWRKIKWDGHTGWMMEKFLLGGTVPETIQYKVVIQNLTSGEADEIVAKYGGVKTAE